MPCQWWRRLFLAVSRWAGRDCLDLVENRRAGASVYYLCVGGNGTKVDRTFRSTGGGPKVFCGE